MKNKVNILIPSLLVSIITILLTTTGLTVAWYASGLSLQISDIDVSIVTDPTLEIGVKDSDGNINYYKDKLPSEVFKDKYVSLFKPVSSMYSSLFIDSKEDYPVFREKYGHPTYSDETTYKSSNVAKDGYFSIELYLRSDSDVYVTVDSNTERTYFKGDTAKNIEKAKDLVSRYPALTKEEIASRMDEIDHSLRFSLLETSSDNYNYTIIDPYKDKDTYFSGSLDIDANGYYDSYIDSSINRKEFYYGEYYNDDKLVYELNEEATSISGESSTFNAGHNENTYVVNVDKSIENGLVRAKEESVSLTTVSDELIALKHNEAKRVVFSIYIEGWDLDNTNVNEYGAFKSSFGFKVSKEYIV